VLLQVKSKLCLCNLRDVAELERKLLALLEKHLLVHLFLGQDVFRVALFVQVRAVVVETRRPSEKEAAVLGSTVRSMHEPAIKDMLVDRQDRDRCLLFRLICQVCSEAKALVVALISLLFVQSDLGDPAILPKVLETSECVFLRNVW